MDLDTLEQHDYLRERYLRTQPRRSPAVRAYYGVKPLIPRRLQLAMRRVYARRQAARTFPAWPIEPLLVEHQAAQFRRELQEAGADRVPLVNFWPDASRFAAVLTHDVEGPRGIELIPRLRELERRRGLVSAWYFVAEDYPIDPELFARLRADGCEIGLHGIHHDGALFSGRKRFEAQLPKIRSYLREWGAVGFRSPATHRNPDWMPELGCEYDTSFPDTAPFEPQAGGCCSIFPFFFEDLVELPITLEMDHTLWEVLRDASIRRWVQKARWIARHHGLVNLLVHPDYTTTDERLALYDEFLDYLCAQDGVWHALPRDVAAWWRARENIAVDVIEAGPEVMINGASHRATVAWARELGGGEIVIET